MFTDFFIMIGSFNDWKVQTYQSCLDKKTELKQSEFLNMSHILQTNKLSEKNMSGNILKNLSPYNIHFSFIDYYSIFDSLDNSNKRWDQIDLLITIYRICMDHKEELYKSDKDIMRIIGQLYINAILSLPSFISVSHLALILHRDLNHIYVQKVNDQTGYHLVFKCNEKTYAAWTFDANDHVVEHANCIINHITDPNVINLLCPINQKDEDQIWKYIGWNLLGLSYTEQVIAVIKSQISGITKEEFFKVGQTADFYNNMAIVISE